MNALKWLFGLVLLIPMSYLGFALARDPGRVSLHVWGWQVDTTLVLALILLALAACLVYLMIWLLWKLPRWLIGRREARLRGEFQDGLIELINGRFARAKKKLSGARSLQSQQGIAAISASYAAMQSGDYALANEYARGLDDPLLAHPVQVLHAKIKLRQQDSSGLDDLIALARSEPSALVLHTLVHELAARGRAGEALGYLSQLAASQKNSESALLAPDWASLLRDSLNGAATLDALSAIWAQIGSRERALPDVLSRYARRAIALGGHELVEPLLREALQKQSSEHLWESFAALPGAELPNGVERLQFVEKSLERHGESVGLLLTLAGLCRQRELSQKAKQLIDRAQALYPSERGFIELGEWARHEGDLAAAAEAYRSAVRARN